MKYIHFEADNPVLFIDWLRNYPAGSYLVTIGSNTATDIDMIFEILTQDLDLAQWLMDKILTGHIRLMAVARD